ncbi:MAG: hypothetical protein J1F71_01610 [Clostridiales bacterium]|nr:hypothetical protein [Clostridiales bacterium]
MKSKFAKFIDGTVGAAMIFFAAFAIFRYFIPSTDLVMFCAASITGGILLIGKIRGIRRGEKLALSKAADDMFFEFMFLPDNAPTALLCNALKRRGENAVRHGGGVYVGKSAAYPMFSREADEATTARIIAKAKHFGADKLILLCKAPSRVPNVDGIQVISVIGDDVYTLFASLNALPERKYVGKVQSRGAFKNMFSPDKILRYALLAVLFYFVSRFSRSIVTFVCGALCAALAITAIMLSIVRAAKKRKTN